MAFYETVSNGVTLVKSSLIPMRHAFTTRYGGVSGGIYASLNLGENRGDDPEAVRENYRRLAGAVGFELDKLVFTKQVHGSCVRTVTSLDSRELFAAPRFECDGLATAEEDLPLICYTADCVPVLLCDPVKNTAAAVHSGWRSTVADISARAVGALAAMGTRPEDIRAAIGPAIGRCCFEVGRDVADAMFAWLGREAEPFLVRCEGAGDKFLADLRGATRHRLISLGLRPENIDVSDECTMCSPGKYWSHRVTQGHRGSQAAVIIPDRRS